MKKLSIQPYLAAIIILLVAAMLAGKVYAIQQPVMMVLGATAILASFNIASILFYLSLNVQSKILRIIFSIINVLFFLFIGMFAVETLGHLMIK